MVNRSFHNKHIILFLYLPVCELAHTCALDVNVGRKSTHIRV